MSEFRQWLYDVLTRVKKLCPDERVFIFDYYRRMEAWSEVVDYIMKIHNRRFYV
jgi:hypothetical protein